MEHIEVSADEVKRLEKESNRLITQHERWVICASLKQHLKYDVSPLDIPEAVYGTPSAYPRDLSLDRVCRFIENRVNLQRVQPAYGEPPSVDAVAAFYRDMRAIIDARSTRPAVEALGYVVTEAPLEE
jgi:hypothetical protein